MPEQNKGRLVWLAAGIILLAGLIYAFWASPFVHATGPFANFQKARAIPAGIIGIAGTVLILVWGWILLKRDQTDKPGNSRPAA